MDEYGEYASLLITGAITSGLFRKWRSGENPEDDKLAHQSEKDAEPESGSAIETASQDPEPAGKPDNNKENDEINKLKQRFENLQIVNELGQHVTSSLDLSETFQHLYDTINSMMDAAVFELGIYNWRDSKWTILSNLGTDGKIEINGNYRNHIAEWSLKNKREVLLNDAEKDYERYVYEPLTLPDGRKPVSIITFPVLRNEKEVGTISVMSFSPDAFNEYHTEMIRSLIPYTAVAIGNSLIHKELIETQDQLIHNEKMASLGSIASGIAHEILNPLNFVNNFSEMSKEILPELEHAKSFEEQDELKTQLLTNLDKIQQHGQRAYSIVKNMLLLSRRNGKGTPSEINLKRSIEEFLDIAMTGFRNKVPGFHCDVEINIDESLPKLNIVAEDFGSVVLNLISNALYTMNEKKKKISALGNDSGLVAYNPKLELRCSESNSMLLLEVIDNGMGIPEEIREKIFLPFFTTKPPGEGTGLGLSISHDIIFKGNKGQIKVESEMNKGTNFQVMIPMNAEA